MNFKPRLLLREAGHLIRGQAEPQLRAVRKGSQLITLDFPVTPRPRYGYGRSAHPGLLALLESGREGYRSQLRIFAGLSDYLLRIPQLTSDPGEPHWRNNWLEDLDLATLYSFIALTHPKRYVEVGSGQSTKVARRAICDHALQTTIVSIDPQPRAEIDALCDETLRVRLEDAPLSIFSQLHAGDMLFLDGSHRCFTNSDVSVAFLDILPNLDPGVLIHIHDIYLPDDYPPEWNGRYYSEQYLLAALLLAGGVRFQVVLPNHFIATDPDLLSTLGALWEAPHIGQPHGWASSFWLRTRA